MNISAASSSMSATLYGNDLGGRKSRPGKAGDDTGFQNDLRGGPRGSGGSFKNDLSGMTLVSDTMGGGSFKNDISGINLIA